MPCIDAIDQNALIFKADMKVEEALGKLKKTGSSVAVILDDDGQATGMFSLKGLMKDLMPVSMPVGGGVVPAVTLDAAPGVAKRLKKLYPLSVGEVMERKLYFVDPESRLIEAMQQFQEYGVPGVIVANEDNEFLGLLTERSVMDRLEALEAES